MNPTIIEARVRAICVAFPEVTEKQSHSAPAFFVKKQFLEPRPGAPRTISDDDVERVIVRTLEDKPTDATHWSTRDLAAKAGMSASSVGQIWSAFGLKPWLTDTFKLSEDPMFVEKVRDVVGLYMNPPEHAVVLCVDEKTSIQALDRTQPSLPM